MSQVSTHSTRRKCVLVAGMHRSGTSALSNLVLGTVGAALPLDPLPADEYNRDGYAESGALTRFNDGLLNGLGYAWSAPPTPAALRAALPSLLTSASRARAVFDQVLPADPVVWKDPRNCLLLPYWLEILDPSSPVVMVWRSPHAVVESLRRMQGVGPALGLALWQRYNGSLLKHLAGRPCYVVSYDRLLVSPSAIATGIAEFLGDQGVPAAAGQATAENLDVSLDHSGSPTQDCMLPEHREMLGVLADLDGRHAALPGLDLPAESPWISELLEDRRAVIRVARLGRDLDRAQSLFAFLAAARHLCSETVLRSRAVRSVAHGRSWWAPWDHEKGRRW